jgi:hypothetical protein
MLKPKPNEGMFFDWAIASELGKFDVFILLSTQGQYVNILRQNKLCKIKSMLIGWNSTCRNSSGEDSRWKTDKILIEYASVYCPLERILNMPNGKHPIVEIMFEKFFSMYPLKQLCG